MTSIKEEAQNYEPAMTANIADLDKVSTSSSIETKTFKEGTQDEFTLKVINVDNQDYRVPLTVLGDLKNILAAKPDLEWFKVTKTGAGMQTRYTLIPL